MIKKLIPIGVIILLIILFYALDLGRFFTFESLKAQHEDIKAFVSRHPITTPLLFITLYIIAVALSLPIAGILTIGMGYLFPLPLSTLYVVIGATIGATIIFLAARSAFSAILYKKVEPFLSKIEGNMKENAAMYLLTMRLIPLIPFWLLNLAPAFLSVPLRTFVWTTFVGIIPGSYVYTQAGLGLASVFEDSDHFTFGAIFTPEVIIAFCVLIAFSLIPIIYKWIRGRKSL
ncbi:MAG: VTT domain-containing protein [Simkaniaceae bacterium]|nr:VTT domain-containing protein [Simkaniaceae bacterium]